MTSFRLMLLLAALELVAAGCSQPETTKQATHAFEFVESYGEASPRSVAIKAAWGVGADEAIELADVNVTLTPGEQPMVKKLETLLEEAGFRWRPGEAQWPELDRMVPPDAIPMTTRLQLALLLLYGADAVTIERPFVDLFSNPPTMGLTRIERKDGAIAVKTIALVMTQDGGVLGWSESTGSVGETDIRITGVRQLGDNPRVPVSTTIRALDTRSPPSSR